MSTLERRGRAPSTMTSQLSKPTTATSAETRRPRSRSAFEEAAGDLIVTGEDRVGAVVGIGEELGRGGAAPGLGPGTGAVVAGRCSEAGGGEPGAPPVAAEADGFEALGAGDVGDAAAAGAGEVVGGEARALRVVGKEAEARLVDAVREDEERRQVAQRHADGGAAVGAASGEDQAVDTLAHQLFDVLALALGFVSGVAHEDADAAVGELALEAFHDRQGEAAEAVVGDEANGEALPAEQRLSEVVRSETELARDADDAGTSLRAQSAGVVQRLRDGADADPGRHRDVADRLPFPADGSLVDHFTAPLRRPAR